MIMKLHNRRGHLGESGVAALELALILPLVLMMTFATVDLGMLIQARLVLTNVAREGGSLASRDIPNPPRISSRCFSKRQVRWTLPNQGKSTSGKSAPAPARTTTPLLSSKRKRRISLGPELYGERGDPSWLVHRPLRALGVQKWRGSQHGRH